MVEFRNFVADAAVSNWQVLSHTSIAFGRGDLGFVAINIGAEPIDASLKTGLQAGHYCNILTGCEGERMTVTSAGTLNTTLAPMSAIAIHN
jgi:alpha-amylase